MIAPCILTSVRPSHGPVLESPQNMLKFRDPKTTLRQRNDKLLEAWTKLFALGLRLVKLPTNRKQCITKRQAQSHGSACFENVLRDRLLIPQAFCPFAGLHLVVARACHTGKQPHSQALLLKGLPLPCLAPCPGHMWLDAGR